MTATALVRLQFCFPQSPKRCLKSHQEIDLLFIDAKWSRLAITYPPLLELINFIQMPLPRHLN